MAKIQKMDFMDCSIIFVLINEEDAFLNWNSQEINGYITAKKVAELCRNKNSNLLTDEKVKEYV